MVLGALYGQYDKEDPVSRKTANTVNDKMMEGFADISGSYICNELLGCDISTVEGVEYARTHNLFTEFCPQMVANAVGVLELIIQEQSSKQNLNSRKAGGINERRMPDL